MCLNPSLPTLDSNLYRSLEPIVTEPEQGQDGRCTVGREGGLQEARHGRAHH